MVRRRGGPGEGVGPVADGMARMGPPAGRPAPSSADGAKADEVTAAPATAPWLTVIDTMTVVMLPAASEARAISVCSPLDRAETLWVRLQGAAVLVESRVPSTHSSSRERLLSLALTPMVEGVGNAMLKAGASARLRLLTMTPTGVEVPTFPAAS